MHKPLASFLWSMGVGLLLVGAMPIAAAAAQPAAAAAVQPAPAPVEPPAAPDHAPQAETPVEHAAPAGPAAPEHAQAPHASGAAEAHESAEAHEESPWGLVARIFNFLLLAGGLVYFLRGPMGRHLATRRTQITADLVSARETTERARQHLAELDRRAKELPAELEALRARGAEEVAAEALRIRRQAEAERHRLLEQTRREVDMQVRLARRALTEHTADLAVKLASDRIAVTMTPDDQTRLIDRYVADVKELHG